MLVTHILVARATIILFLSQIAILTASVSFEKGVPEEDEHAKHDQERRGNESQVTQALKRR